MVWGRRYYIVIVPIVMLIAGTACGFTATFIELKMYLLRVKMPLSATTSLPGWNKLYNLVNNMSVAFYATSFVTNILTSSLIAGKIWHTTRESRRHLGHDHVKSLHRIATLIIDSGIIYSILLLLQVVLDPLSNEVAGVIAVIIGDITTQIVGIFPTLIIVLVALGKTSDQTSSATSGIFNNSRNPPSVPIAFAPGNSDRDAMTESRVYDLDIEAVEMGKEEDRGFVEESSSWQSESKRWVGRETLCP